MRSCHSGDSLTSRYQSTAPLSTEADEAAAPAASTASNPLIGTGPADPRAGGRGRRDQEEEASPERKADRASTTRGCGGRIDLDSGFGFVRVEARRKEGEAPRRGEMLRALAPGPRVACGRG
jgi:hypothetical protein